LRCTRLEGVDSSLFAVLTLARVLGISETTARDDLRSFHEKGCIKIEDRSKFGHRVCTLLPGELDGLAPGSCHPEVVDLESIDFYSERRYVDALLGREGYCCFYCMRNVQKETCQPDHVVPRRRSTQMRPLGAIIYASIKRSAIPDGPGVAHRRGRT